MSFHAFAPVTAADLGLPAPQAVTAAIPLFLVGVLMWRRWLPRLAACLALVTGAALTSGWLYVAVSHGVRWVTDLVNLVTRTTVGGVAPGALAIILLVYFVLELRPDPGTVGALARLRDDPQALTRRLASRPGNGRYSGGTAVRTRRGRPGKLGAAGVGLVLPSVAAAIPGTAGAVVMTVLNVVGGAFAWPISQAFGVG
jgi:hypothetical protein